MANEAKEPGLKRMIDELRAQMAGEDKTDPADDILAALKKKFGASFDIDKMALPFDPSLTGAAMTEQVSVIIDQLLDKLAPTHQCELTAAGQVLAGRVIRYKIHMLDCPVCGSDKGKEQFTKWLAQGTRVLQTLQSWQATPGMTVDAAFEELKALTGDATPA